MVSFSSVKSFRACATTPPLGTDFKHSEQLRFHDEKRGQATVELAMVGQTKVGRVRSTGHDVSVLVSDCISVLLPRRGAVKFNIRETLFQAGVNEVLVLSPSTRQCRGEARPGDFVELVPLYFPLAMVREMAQEMGGSVLARKRLDNFGLKLSTLKSPQATHFLQLSQMLVQDLDSENPVISKKGAQSWSQLLTEKLVFLLDSNGVIELPRCNRDTAAHRHVFRAEDYMHEHFAEIPTVADIARICGVSVRTLEMAFRSVRSQSPMALLGDIRLDRAHRRFCKQSGVESVTRVALDCGFTHLGRFSVAYRRRYGETPSATMRKI